VIGRFSSGKAPEELQQFALSVIQSLQLLYVENWEEFNGGG